MPLRWSTSMANKPKPRLPAPRRGEIWTAYLGPQRSRHWVVIVSLNSHNQSDGALSVLTVPFRSRIKESPAALVMQPGETGLPGPSCLRAHFISTEPKQNLIERQPRALSETRMRQICALIRRSYD